MSDCVHRFRRVSRQPLAAALLLASFGTAVRAARADWPQTIPFAITTLDDGGAFAKIGLTPAGEPCIAYQGGGAVKFIVRDHGTWTPPQVIETVNSQFISLAVDGSGQPHVSYGYGGILKYATHANAWWEIDTVAVGGGFVSAAIALDRIGHPHVAYYDLIRETFWYASKDSGRWSSVRIPGGGQFCAMAIGTSDEPVIVANASPIIYTWHDGNGWHSEDVEPGYYPSVGIDSTGISWMSYSTGGMLAIASRSTGSWARDLSAPSLPYTSGTSLAFDQSGNPWVGCYSSMFQTLRLAYRRDGNWSSQVVDSIAQGSDCSLTLSNDGWPRLTYAYSGRLRYAEGPIGLGVTAPPAPSAISAFPSPAHRGGLVTLPWNDSGSGARLTAFDIFGRVAHVEDLAESSSRWRVPSRLNPGVYLLRVRGRALRRDLRIVIAD
jgi:hypothetical protein